MHAAQPRSVYLQGALAGLGSALVLVCWIGVGSIVTRVSGAKPLPPSCRAANTTFNLQGALWNITVSRPSGLQRFYSLSYMWYSAFSCLTVVFVGLFISFLSGPLKEEDVTPGTVYPCLGKLLCFLPERLKKKLCCVTPLGHSLSAPQKESEDRESPEAQTLLVEYETNV